MNFRIEERSETKLVGLKLRSSVGQDKTAQLWGRFMPQRSSIVHQMNNELFSVEEYDSLQFFERFDPSTEFTKWAAVEVDRYEDQPDSFEHLTIPRGLYVVFTYRGKAQDAAPFFQSIYGKWIPESSYELDHRPHIAVMGEKYKHDDPNSEEEIWVPIKDKTINHE